MPALARWKFDAGSGTNLADAVDTDDAGTLSSASAWSGDYPSAISGNAGSLNFAGAYYATFPAILTLGKAISASVSLWIKYNSVPGTRHSAFGIQTAANGFDFNIGSSYDGDGVIACDIGQGGVNYQPIKQASVAITNCQDNGSGAIQVTAVGHGMTTGRNVNISGVLGTTEANGTGLNITVLDADNFVINGSTFTNAYTSDGSMTPQALIGTWMNLIVVMKNGSADLYIDGVFQNTITYDSNTNAASNSSGGYCAGTAFYAGSEYTGRIDARVDDIRVFDYELDSTERANLAAGAGPGQGGGGGSAPVVSLTRSTTAIAENAGAVSIIATMDATASATVNVVVGFAGAATTGSDYSLSTTTISITSGQTSGSLTATAIQDAIYEGNEAFTASITSVTGGDASASSTASTSVVTITDDDSPPSASLSASTNSIAEAGGVVTIYALLNQTASASVTVGFSASGVASSSSDYSLSTNSITIASGQTSGSITATAISDSVYEGNEAFTIAIASISGGGATLSANSSASVTIIDDDSGSVYLTSSAVSVAEANASAALVAVISATESATVNVILSLSGAATSGSDYSFGATSISIPSGSTSGSISFTTIQDTLDENTETVVIAISSITGAGSYTHNSTGWLFTIADDDPTPTVTVAASTASITENAGSAAFIATLSAASGRTASATVNVGFGTATENVDFTASTATFFWPAGTTTASIGVTSLADILFESNETIVLSLATLQNCAIGSPFSASITIVNEYLAPFVNLTASTTSISENSGSATVYVRLDHTHSADVTVVVAFTGSATLNTDYSRSTDSVVIASGASSGSISITALQDSVGEANETIIVSISNVTNGTAASSASATTVTIVDDDAAPSAGLTGLSALRGLSAIH